MKPLRDFVLIENISEETDEKRIGGIILPAGTDKGDLCAGTVTDIGPKIDPAEEELTIGSRVYFLREQDLSKDSKQSIIHISKVLAVEEDPTRTKDQPHPIKVLEWKDYKTDGYNDFWKELTNFREFRFRLKYMKPFVKITNFQREVYEALMEHIATPMIGPNATVVLAGDKEKDELAFVIDDDIFGGKVDLDSDAINVVFKKDDLQAIIKKLPHYMAAVTSIATSPALSRVFGKTFNRVTVATFGMEQVIKLVGKGRNAAADASNKEILAKIVNLGKSFRGSSTVLDTLSPVADSAGRVDLKLSIERDIAGHEYTVWVTLQAPTNEDSTYLWAKLEIQDHSPGFLSDRDYTPIMTDFLRDCYFETFLKELFGDIYCTTLGSK